MHEVKQVNIDGIPLVYPALTQNLPNTIAGFGTCCGAGKGFGDWIVPDTPFGVSFSPACKSHDDAWALWPVSMETFVAANSLFEQNLHALVNHLTDPGPFRDINHTFAKLYYNVVTGHTGLMVYCAYCGVESYKEWSRELFG